MAVKIGWTQNAWTFGEPNPWRFYQSLGGHGWMKAQTRRWSIFEAVYVINVPLKPKFLTSIQAVWWFLYNMHAFLQFFFDNIITHTHSLYSQMCVFSHWIPFRFRLLSTCSSTYYLYIFRKAGRAPEPVECSPVSDSRSRASDAWHGPVSRWWWKNTWQNNHHLVFFFLWGVGVEGEFHFMLFFFGSLVVSWGVLVLMMWSC